MKKRIAFIAVLALLTVGFGWALQRPDLASNLTGSIALQPAFYANSATTGTWVDIANYNGVAFIVQKGLVQNTDTIYLVFQDSTSGVAVAAFDSVMIGAGLDSTYEDVGYQRSGRFVRTLLRASGGAGDSNVVGVAVVGTPRSR